MCDQCGTSLSDSELVLYNQKLTQALHHPLPEAREMAARLLGQLRDQHALPVLAVRLFEETDSGALCAIIEALGQPGECQAVASLAKRLAQPNTLVVSLTIVDAIAALAQTGCWEALNVLKFPPSVPERIAQEITTKLETLNLLYY